MAGRPVVRRGFRVERVDGEAVYLLSERGHHVLEGDLVEEVVPLLDGKRDLDEIFDAVPEAAPERVAFLVDRLTSLGVVLPAGDDVPGREAAFWDLAGIAAKRAVDRLATATVRVTPVGDVDPAAVADALAALGVRVEEREAADVDLAVVVTDDYLHHDLERPNAAALRAGRPWLLAKPVGTVMWFGPVFRPGTTACWACLAYRVADHRQVDEYLAGRAGHRGPLPVPLADLGVTRGIGARMVAWAAARHLGGIVAPDGVLTWDSVSMQTRLHPLHRRPQCPACGDADLVRREFSRPVVLRPAPKTYVGDGGHRTRRPEEVLAKYGSQISSITGVVGDLRPFETGLDFVKGYHAGHNFARRVTRLRDLRLGLRSNAAGKGRTDVQARASALCEAIERYSGLFSGDEPRITATLAELGDRAVAPNEYQRYSERQYATRARWNAEQRSNFHVVCDPLPPDEAIDWSPVWSLTHDRPRYVPSASLYFHYPTTPGKLFAWACSNGNAAGSSLEDAVLQGFLELVERDSVAIWWYNRVRRPRFDLAGFADPWFDEFVEVYRSLHREVWVLDLTGDLGIPVAAAVTRRTDLPTEDILIGLGAHLDARIAVQRALSELNQFLPAVIGSTGDGSGYAYPDPVQLEWWRTAKVADLPYLRPVGAPIPAGRHRDRSGTDLRDDVEMVRGLVESRGLEMLVHNQTRPDIGLPVVKVMVPGLRHFWARFGTGRLYDVPVELGWLDRPTAEADLNPIPMFL